MTASQPSRERDGEARAARRMARVPDRIAAVSQPSREADTGARRAAENQRHVRELVRQRDPVLARALGTLSREPRPAGTTRTQERSR